MTYGPTQNYNDETLGVWLPRPILAACVRVLLLALPLLLAVAFGFAAVQWLPPQRLGVDPWAWLAVQVACSTGLLMVLGRQARRLLPLSTLLRLTLYFPDRAPSRLAVARRTHSPEALRQRVAAATENDRAPGTVDLHALRLLELIGLLNAHDRTTFSHSERVQAYAALIGAQLGLPPAEAAKLSWAALLHDIGKLHVPTEILNKSGRPTDQEWRVLATHPAEGATLAAPLRDWLGPWLGAVGQHHERWDGQGYPRGLAGSQISHAARIVAVADAYDVITTARPYKKPLSATVARAELARCSGTQFDPEVVRAFLTVGLGRLRVVAGPVSAISALPALRSMPLPDLSSTLSSVVHAAPAIGAAATATVVAAAFSVADPLVLTPPRSDVVLSQDSDAAVAASGPGIFRTTRWMEPSGRGTGPGASVRTVDPEGRARVDATRSDQDEGDRGPTRGPAPSAAPQASGHPDRPDGGPGTPPPPTGSPDRPAAPTSTPPPNAGAAGQAASPDDRPVHAEVPGQGTPQLSTDR